MQTVAGWDKHVLHALKKSHTADWNHQQCVSCFSPTDRQTLSLQQDTVKHTQDTAAISSYATTLLMLKNVFFWFGLVWGECALFFLPSFLLSF